MATGVLKRTTVVGLAEEVTAGTYVAPTDWLLPFEGIEAATGREALAREVLRSSIGAVKPRVGIKSVTGSYPLEFKAGGAEGDAPEADLLYKSLLGTQRQIAARITTKTGNGVSQLEINDGDIGSLSVGDFIIVLEAGDHTMHFITAVDPSIGTANVTISPARGGAPSDNVEISKSTTYLPVAGGTAQPYLSGSIYWGDEILQKVLGTKVVTFELGNFTVGQLPQANFGFEGLSFDQEDASSTSPVFSTALPPVLLEACIYQNGVALELNSFSLTVSNELAKQSDLCDPSGTTGLFYSGRSISGTMNPYMDDTTVDQFDKFNLNQSYDLIVTASTPSATAGEIELGSACGVYLPDVTTIGSPIGDVEGVLVDDISFEATAGSSGANTDIFIGFV